MNHAYQILASRLLHVEYLIGYEGDAFAFTGDVRRDLLRESAVSELLTRAQAEWSLVEALIAENRLKQVEYLGKRYYVRRFATQHEE